MSSTPSMLQVVLDATDARRLAEFYRELLGYVYRPGDEPRPDESQPGWLVIRHPSGAPRIAFQLVPALPRSTWPNDGVPQQLHLDLMVHSLDELNAQHARVQQLGATLLYDRSADPQEPLYVYADPSGHPFCIFVA